MIRVLDGIDAFIDQLTSVHPFPLFLAILAHLVRLACTSRALRTVCGMPKAASRNQIVTSRKVQSPACQRTTDLT